jgi:NAD+ synthase (glutamine-hydrolysing)
MLRIAIAQINTTVGDLAGNREKICRYIDQARSQQVDVIVFPELAITGYPPEDLLHKPHFIQDNLKSLREVIKMVYGITAVIGFVDRDQDQRIYNAAAVITQKKTVGIYHKQALPNYGVFDEKRYFKEAVSPDRLFSWVDQGIGVSICEDIWIDNGIVFKQARLGAVLLINISCSPYDFGKLAQRERLLRRRAQETNAFICYANTVGGQDELVFDGGSLILDPKGKILASGKQFEEDLIMADLPIQTIKKKNRSRKCIPLIALPAHEKIPLKKHISARYSQLERVYKALVLGTRDYIGKNGFQKAVIGLSGGIDSAVVAVIAREAIGPQNVIAISMPSRYNSSETRSDAQKLAENLGIRFLEIPIQELFEGYLKILEKEFAGLSPNMAEENLQARIRGNLLMAFSNKFGWLVLTTGNKSEIAVGYCTLYGDMTGGFAVIKDVPKTQVYAIAQLINESQGKIIPESILIRPPSAELRDHQKDEDSLPPYNILDAMLKAYVEEHRSLIQMKKSQPQDELNKAFIRMVDRSEYKRRQAPPGVKITSRAFGRDWRLPITNKYSEF